MKSFIYICLIFLAMPKTQALILEYKSYPLSYPCILQSTYGAGSASGVYVDGIRLPRQVPNSNTLYHGILLLEQRPPAGDPNINIKVASYIDENGTRVALSKFYGITTEQFQHHTVPISNDPFGPVTSTWTRYVFRFNPPPTTQTVVEFLQSPSVKGGRIEGLGFVAPGQYRTLKAIPDLGYSFQSWRYIRNLPGLYFKGDELEYQNLGMYTEDLSGFGSRIRLNPNFKHIFDPVRLHTGSIPSSGGSVEGGGVFEPETTLTISATPSQGFVFSHWSVVGSYFESGSLEPPAVPYHSIEGSTDNPLTFTMDAGDGDIFANFVGVAPYNLHTKHSYGGSVNGAGSYPAGTVASLTAIPEEGYVFSGWSGDTNGTTNPVSIIVDGNKTATAHFRKKTWTTTTSSTIGGSVAGGGTYDHNSTATLSAVPEEGYEFSGWSGDANGTTNPVYIIVDGNKSATATFTLRSTDWVVRTNTSSGGYPTIGGGGYSEGEVATLIARPMEGHVFAGWSGDANGTANPHYLVVDGDKNVTALFFKPHWEVTILQTQGGIVRQSPLPSEVMDWPSFDFGSLDSGNWHSEGLLYEHDRYARIIAISDPGYLLFEWNPNGRRSIQSHRSVQNLQVRDNFIVSANFKAAPLELHSTVGGNISESWGHDSVILIATPQNGYEFKNWSGLETYSINRSSAFHEIPYSRFFDFNATTKLYDLWKENKTFTAHFEKLSWSVATKTEGKASLDGGNTFVSEYIPAWSQGAPAGNYFIEEFKSDIRPEPYYWLVGAALVDGNWKRKQGMHWGKTNFASLYPHLRQLGDGYIVEYDVSSSRFGNKDSIEAYFSEQQLQPVGYIVEDHNHTQPSSAIGENNETQGLPVFELDLAQVETLVGAALHQPIVGGTVSGGGTYEHGSMASLTAVPEAGFKFMGWSGDASGMTNPLSVSVEGNKNITANFKEVFWRVNVKKTVGGKILSMFEGHRENYRDWPDPRESWNWRGHEGDYNETWQHGVKIRYFASADPGYEFTSWNAGGPDGNRELLTIDGDKIISANFQKFDTLSVWFPSDKGNVELTVDEIQAPAKITSEITFSEKYGWGLLSESSDMITKFYGPAHSVVTLAATPKQGYAFLGWSEHQSDISFAHDAKTPPLAFGNANPISFRADGIPNAQGQASIFAEFKEVGDDNSSNTNEVNNNTNSNTNNEGSSLDEWLLSSVIANWYESHWLGVFFKKQNPSSQWTGWVYHSKLGWLYLSRDSKDGLWIYFQGTGWRWTKKDIFPNLYDSKSGGWKYFKTDSGKNKIYDYSSGKWTNL